MRETPVFNETIHPFHYLGTCDNPGAHGLTTYMILNQCQNILYSDPNSQFSHMVSVNGNNNITYSYFLEHSKCTGAQYDYSFTEGVYSSSGGGYVGAGSTFSQVAAPNAIW